MRNLTFFVSTVFAVLSSVSSSSVWADSWSDQIIDTKKIDFGVVATGSATKQLVEIKNVLTQTIHISGIRTSCPCVQWKMPDGVSHRYLQPGESCILEVMLDTQKFRQKRDANLMITMDAPRYAEHSIPVSAYIRTDVVFNPGMIRFGEVELGKPGQSVVDIAYAGRPDWDIVDVKFENPALKASLSKPERSAGLINYRLTMALNETAKAGRIRDVVTLVTNDKTNPFIPLMIDGIIVPDITVSPSILKVGTIATGKSSRVQVALKGKTPFQIESIECEAMANSFRASISDSVRPFHLVPIEFSGDSGGVGAFNEELVIRIVGRPEPLLVTVTGAISN